MRYLLILLLVLAGCGRGNSNSNDHSSNNDSNNYVRIKSGRALKGFLLNFEGDHAFAYIISLKGYVTFDLVSGELKRFPTEFNAVLFDSTDCSGNGYLIGDNSGPNGNTYFKGTNGTVYVLGELKYYTNHLTKSTLNLSGNCITKDIGMGNQNARTFEHANIEINLTVDAPYDTEY